MSKSILCARGAAALVLVLAACSRTPQQREVRFLKQGVDHLRKNDYSRASLEFRNAIQALPTDAEPYYQLGLTYLGSGDRRSAVACFRKAAELNPKHSAAQLKLAEILSTASDPSLLADAEQRAQTVAAASPESVDALNTLAMTELRLGKPEEAESRLEQALKLVPDSVESSALLMRARLSQGDVKGAEEALQQCFRKFPQSAEVALVMGRFYLVIHRPDQAEQQFRRALQIKPGYAAAMLDLGMTLYHSDRREEAGRVFRQLAAMADKTFKPVYAIFLLETGQREASIAELERLAREDPADRIARTRLVKMYMISGRQADARRLLAAVIAKNPNDADALLQRSQLSLDAAKYQDAQNDLNLVLRYQPDSAEAHVQLARLDQALGKPLRQRQELAEALRLNPYLIDARLNLAALLVVSKGASSALEILRQAPESERHSVAWIAQSVWALMDLNRLDEARQSVADGLRISRSPELLLQDALLKMNAKDGAGARASAEAVLQQDAEDVRALRVLARLRGLPAIREYAAKHQNSAAIQNYLGELQVAESKPGDARASFQAALTNGPNFRPAELNLARLDVTEGKLDAAHKILSRLLATSQADPELWLYMGWLANTEKNYSQAVSYFRKVIEADPANVVALNNLAYLLASQNDQFDEALKYAQQVKEIAPDNKGVDDTIGWIMYRKGLYPSAVKYLESAAGGPPDPVVRYHLGMAYVRVGDKRGGPTLRAALKSAPNLPEARMAEQLLAATHTN